MWDAATAPILTLRDAIRQRAALDPRRPAVLRADGDCLTYHELSVQTDAIAALLRLAGIRRGDRVGIMTPGTLHLPLLLGAASAAIAVPLFPAAVTGELRAIVTDPQTARELVVDETSPAIFTLEDDRLSLERGLRGAHVCYADPDPTDLAIELDGQERSHAVLLATARSRARNLGLRREPRFFAPAIAVAAHEPLDALAVLAAGFAVTIIPQHGNAALAV